MQRYLNEIASTNENINFIHNGAHAFPDLKVTINDSIFGIEIKFSNSGNWRSKGNSIFESLSDESEYEEIFVLYGRKPKKKETINHIDIKYAPYGDSIERIEVTHSPRFAINMNSKNEIISELFREYGSYDNFRKLDVKSKNNFLREYFNRHKENLGDKWYINLDSNSYSEDSLPQIEPVLFSNLPTKMKNQIINEAFILFPKYLFDSPTNYSNLAAYMITQYFVYSTSLRDSFSAGGKTIILDKDNYYPRMLMKFYTHRACIKTTLTEPNHGDFAEQCFKNWKVQFPTISFDENESLEFNYDLILRNYQPELEIEHVLTSAKSKITVDLMHYYK